MPDFDDDEIVRLRAALGRISRLLDRQVSGDGMTRTNLSVLGAIGRRGPIGASELADHEGINPTMLSRILSKLEERGLVVRTADETDRRVVQVKVTPAGARMHNRLRDERARMLAERLAQVPTPQAQKLLDALPALEALAVEMARETTREATREPAKA
ncbi:DNA-binding MarR family transcriptional regulator [Jatrophihabitans sp. GAS493]|uniref:MarR family winged helix-turn-helix transcriptional regulator n=1 Tax=Jatrophihabitans sp. GAS493 TaxID=1907575 RepID=UPI000BB894CA|nr:MarR family transcriptional regulator [Jatrophihabitans sp. GAS493]SOD71753.1 DNA-binding MarR family transcriptional regulator [Jatrophihabitans sp. GAS493]